MRISLKLEAEAFIQALRELGDLGIDFPHTLAEFARFDVDLAASSASELLVRLKPTDSLAVLVAAAGARDVNRSAV
jgi:hypothetical protein